MYKIKKRLSDNQTGVVFKLFADLKNVTFFLYLQIILTIISMFLVTYI